MERGSENTQSRSVYRAPRRPRWGTLALVVAGHLVVGAGLIRAFAPQFPAQAIEAVGSLVTVTITTPPDPTPIPSTQPDAGAAAEEGRRATPHEPPIPVRPTPVPRASSTGAIASGAGDEGSGAGAGGDGSGSGSGAGGGGQGSGAATKPVLVSGAIDDARAYPVPEGGRENRIGKTVIVALTVGTDGRPSACRTYRSSGLPETDAVTCRLALERLRFRPATNARGEPVVGTFYWQQRFFF
jgi:protein TonB